MQTRTLVLAACAALAVAAAADAKPPEGRGGGGKARGRPVRKVVPLANPGLDADAKGKLDVKHFPAVGKRAERSWFRIAVRRLDAGATYTLWMDDPSTAEDATLVLVADLALVTNEDGNAHLRLDTKKGDAMPFGAPVDTLAGMALEVRAGADGSGGTVLTANVPETTPPAPEPE